MTTKEINSERNEKGVWCATNERAGWFAISRDNIHMITFRDGSNKFYTEKGFAKRVTLLLNRGY